MLIKKRAYLFRNALLFQNIIKYKDIPRQVVQTQYSQIYTTHIMIYF